MTADWPYAEDGVRRDVFAESLRLPLIAHPYPRWCYITAVVVAPEETVSAWCGIRPTDDELRVVASFHQEYLEYWYRPGYLVRMRERLFDLDGGANGRYLIKYEHGGWAYRHASWQYGPCFVPGPGDEPRGLIAVLDDEHSLGAKRWQQWKADHAEVFAAVAS